VVTDRVLQGTNVLWGIEDLRPPNLTLSGHNKSSEEREIQESLFRQSSQVGGDGGEARLSFWEKYFELQVSNWLSVLVQAYYMVLINRNTWPMLTVTLVTIPSGLPLRAGH
jgi:hypothetical protein